MEFNFEKNTVTIFSKNHKIDQVVNKLSSLSGEQVHSFFTNRNILIPRRLNCLALYSVLNKKLRFVNSSTFARDYFERLQYYSHFTELQLFNLYKEIATFDDFAEYRKNLFNIVLQNYVALNFKDGEIQYLLNLKKLPLESFEDYFECISCSCYEQDNTFDGYDSEVLLQILDKSASTSEIYALGEKYGITLPVRLKKDEFVKYIYWYLEKNRKLNNNIRENINNMTINELNALAKSKDINMSVSLQKSELVEYLFYMLSQYEIPRTQVKRLVVTEEFNPINFEVKLENAAQFKTDVARKVLFFENDELDKDSLAFENELTNIYNDVKEDEKSYMLDEQEVKTYELPKKEIKLLVVNEVNKEDLTALKHKVKGVEAPKVKPVVKEEKVETINEVVEEMLVEEVIEQEILIEEVVNQEKITEETVVESKEETITLDTNVSDTVSKEDIIVETKETNIVEEKQKEGFFRKIKKILKK